MRCLNEALVQRYIDAEISPRRVKKVTGHLSGCPKCRELVETARAKTVLCKERLALLLPDEVPGTRFVPPQKQPSPLPRLTLPRLRWQPALAVLLISLLVGVLAVKLFTPSPAAHDSPALESSRYLQALVRQHIADAEPVIIAYANRGSRPAEQELMALEKELARRLLLQNHLLQSRLGRDSRADQRELLEELELVLTEIANLDRNQVEKAALIKELLEIKKTLYKI